MGNGARSNEELFRHTKLIGAAYRADLARELQLLGYEIRLTDKEGGFELAHINRAQIEAFSQRSRMIEDALSNRMARRAPRPPRSRERSLPWRPAPRRSA